MWFSGLCEIKSGIWPVDFLYSPRVELERELQLNKKTLFDCKFIEFVQLPISIKLKISSNYAPKLKVFKKTIQISASYCL